MTTVSPFARASVFDEPRVTGREQTVSQFHTQTYRFPDHKRQQASLPAWIYVFVSVCVTDRGNVQRAGEFLGD